MNADVPSSDPSLVAWRGKAILLVDLDAFFASVEQLDHPEWRGEPVIVGGDPGRRGVVATCSYEARVFGVRSAMPASQAKLLCPQAHWTRGRFSRYREVSNQVMDILRDETPFVEQVSIDEAFLDVTPTRTNRTHPIEVARTIIERVDGLGVTCSIGMGTSKAIAKIASDLDKPHGLTVVYPGGERAFLNPLPIRVMSGIGASAERKLRRAGIETLEDLAEAEEGVLASVFGKNAQTMRARAMGINDSEVETERDVKSVSKEITFSEDLSSREDILSALAALATQVGRRLRKKALKGSVITLRIRYANRETHTAQTQLASPSDNEAIFISALEQLLDGVWSDGMKVRLLGVGLSHFEDATFEQESLFDDISPEGSLNAEAVLRRARLAEATDALKDRFGESAVQFGHELRNAEKTTGTSSKRPADYHAS